MGKEETRFHEDGCCYVCDTEFFRQTGCRVYPPAYPVVIRPSVNIDEEEDLEVAELLLKRYL
jgi:CMP-N-acetylneuraminic acid synthetase